MAIPPKSLHILLGSCFSIFMGVLFTYIIGDINSSHYLLEFMSLMLVELPFIAIYALFVRKFDWLIGIIYVFIGTAASFAMVLPEMSLAPVIFLKMALMGIILGKHDWFQGSFMIRILAVSFPGIVFAFFFGLPLVFNGVEPEVLEEIKRDSLEVYQTFMTKDDALNALDNAILFFEGIFRVGFAIYFLFSLVLSWLSFYFTGWLMGRFNEVAEYVPTVYSFKLPFHAVWILFAGGALWISGYAPVIPAASNVLAVMAGLYGIQGLAIVTCYLNRILMRRLPKILFWVIFFLLIDLTSMFLVFIGVIDNRFNLRPEKYFKESEEEGSTDESDS